LGDPNDPLVDAILRLGEVAEALSIVSSKLTEVARDVKVVRQQQQAHGVALETLERKVTGLEERIADLEMSSVHG
jgi:hypothetical protein